MSEKNDKTQARNFGAGIHKTRLDYTDPMLLLEIEGLARDGYDNQQIAEILDVSPKSFGRNKNKSLPKAPDNPSGGSLLSQALKKGRRPLSVLVENSLYRRAIGQKVKTVSKSRKWLVIDGKAKQYTDETETETELPGDVAACGLWLKTHKAEIYNQQPQKIDLTSQGEKIASEAPKFTVIEHVIISDKDVVKQEIEEEI